MPYEKFLTFAQSLFASLIKTASAITLAVIVFSAAATSTVASAETEAEKALNSLLDAVKESQAKVDIPAFGIDTPEKRAEAQKAIAHILATGLDFWLEANPDRPVFKQYVTTTRKLLGDNPDSLYYFAPIRDDRSYRISGNIGSAVFTSFTIEGGSFDGHAASSSIAALSDREMEIAADGSYSIIVSRKKPKSGNWLQLKKGAGQITTRHYHENAISVAANPDMAMDLRIEAQDPDPLQPYGGDSEVAEKLSHVANFVREHSVMSLMQPNEMTTKMANWFSLEPNKFATPSKWIGAADEQAYGNTHAYYSAAPFKLGKDEALIIEGRFPQAVFANLVVWNHFMQTLDFANRTTSFNRKQIRYEEDGSFKLVLAHKDPGTANWLDTEGRQSGVIYWRWVYPTEQPPTPTTRVVPFASLKSLK